MNLNKKHVIGYAATALIALGIGAADADYNSVNDYNSMNTAASPVSNKSTPTVVVTSPGPTVTVTVPSPTVTIKVRGPVKTVTVAKEAAAPAPRPAPAPVPVPAPGAAVPLSPR